MDQKTQEGRNYVWRKWGTRKVWNIDSFGDKGLQGRKLTFTFLWILQFFGIKDDAIMMQLWLWSNVCLWFWRTDVLYFIDALTCLYYNDMRASA